MGGSRDPGMETPLAPLPDVAEERTSRKSRRAARGKRRFASLRAFVALGLAHALASWRVLGFIVLVQLLLGLTVVLPFGRAIAERLDHHAHASALAGSPDALDQGPTWKAGLDSGIWRDIKREEASLFQGLTVTHFWIAVVAWLFGALVAGGLLGTALSGENPVRVGSFLTLGAKNYGRMLRMGIVFALAYYVVGRLVFEAWGKGVASTEFMDSSQGAGWWGARAREAVVLALFLWFRLAADLGRAEMIRMSRTSALGAFLRGLLRSLKLRYLSLALAIGVPAFLLVLALSFAVHALTGDAWGVLVALFFVFQLAVLLRWASRAALLGALAKAPH